MAITFNPATKVIQLDSFSASEREIWTAMVNWSLQGDNLKYGVNIMQVGGEVPIALYVYLTNGWRIRPKEESGTTTITGNLLTSNGDSPIIPTLGNWNILVNMETPVQAVSIKASSTDPVAAQDIHQALDSYENKDEFKNDTAAIAASVWNHSQ